MLDPGNYTVSAFYRESTYYTEIFNYTNFEVLNTILKKITVNESVHLGDNVDFVVVVTNPGILNENATGTDDKYLTMHNITVTEIFNTAELEYVNHTNSSDLRTDREVNIT